MPASDQAREVRYERLRPGQIRAQRMERPVAFLPLGTLEWHGLHNPVGLDTMKAHALCVRAAEAAGGLVFPPLWYGEARENALVDYLPPDRDAICAAYGIPPAQFEPGYMGYPKVIQDQNYQWLLLHMLYQAQSLGFKVAAVCAGHYPLLDHARAAASIFHQQQFHRPWELRCLPWVFTGYELVVDQFPFAGDHAAYWETSLLMALDDNGTVDLSVLPADKREPLLGVGGPRPPQEANAADGEKYVAAILDEVNREVDKRLDNPIEYYGHGLEL